MDYNIKVYITDGTKVTMPVKYDKIYDLRRDVTNIGVSGLMQELDDKFIYYPPQKIEKIEVEKN